MSYQAERDQFVARMTREGLELGIVLALLRAATSLQRYAELACSSEAADRDRVKCPADPRYHYRKPGVCLCDGDGTATGHLSIPRITLQAGRLERRIAAMLTTAGRETSPAFKRHQRADPHCTCPDCARDHAAQVGTGWTINTQGDPRGYVLRVIPPSYAERNAGRDRHNLEAIGVPARDSRLRF